MAHSEGPRILIDFGDRYEQQQSPLFTDVPLEIRRHIYRQLWLDYGTTQHIHLFSSSSYLSHYPCLLKEDSLNRPGPPSSAPSELVGPSDVVTGDEAQDIEEGIVYDDPYDDPGDIDGAIQDIVSASELQPVPTAPDEDGSGNSEDNQVESSSWCMHKKCFVAYMQAYGMLFDHAYSVNYRRPGRVVFGRLGIAKPLLVCKKMYTEASESLYSTMTFTFPNFSALGQFMNVVPQALTRWISTVHLTTTIPPDGAGLWPEAKSLPDPNTSLPPMETFCTALKSVLSNVQELRLCIHLTGVLQQKAPRRLPGKDWFEPLYRLSDELSQQRLRKMDVDLVTRCEAKNRHWSLTYGSTPEWLKDAPFRTVLVPQGWHEDSKCCAFWVDQNGGPADY